MIDTATIARLLTALEDRTFPCPEDGITSDVPCSHRVQVLSADEGDFSGCPDHSERLAEGHDLASVNFLLGQAAERRRLRQIVGMAT